MILIAIKIAASIIIIGLALVIFAACIIGLMGAVKNQKGGK